MERKLTVVTKIQDVSLEDFDKDVDLNLGMDIDVERMIMMLSDRGEVEVLLLRFIGYDYKEITKILHLKNVGKYFALWKKLREEIQILRDK